jgi:hypothetical protein
MILGHAFAFNTIYAADEHIALLESQIARLQAELCVAKRTRNHLSPLCRMPNEILTYILRLTQIEDLYNEPTRLYDFSYNSRWVNAMQTCTRIHEVCVLCPVLWSYIDLSWPTRQIREHLSRAQDLDLILKWDSIIQEGYDRYYGISFTHTLEDMDMSLAGACFRRSRAAEIHLLNHDDTDFTELLSQATSQMALALTTVHLVQEFGDQLGSFFGWLTEHMHPAIVELTISSGTMGKHIEANLPRLQRLHLHDIDVDGHFRFVIDFLQHTPRLTELLLDKVRLNTTAHEDLEVREGSLSLADLKRIVLLGNAIVICNLLTALSPTIRELQEMVVDVESNQEEWSQAEHDVSAKLFRKVMQHCKAGTGLPLPCAQLVGKFPSSSELIEQSYIQVRTSGNAIPALALKTIHRNDQAHLYRQFGLEFDTLELQRINDTQWTTLLELIGSLEGMPVLKELTFDTCYEEIPIQDLKDWVIQRISKGFVVPKVCFKCCRKDKNMKTYLALKQSGLVAEVAWSEMDFVTKRIVCRSTQ